MKASGLQVKHFVGKNNNKQDFSNQQWILLQMSFDILKQQLHNENI